MKKRFTLIIFTLLLVLGVVTVICGEGKNTIIRTRNLVLWKVLGTSGEDGVIAGKDGFLFYADTLDDYTGDSRLSDEEISDILSTLSSIKSYCDSIGAEFCFAVIPDKNSIYPEKMPSRYVRNYSDNASRLAKAAEGTDINVPDIRAMLLESKEDGLIYHKTDTHWNNIGCSVFVDYITDTYKEILTDSYKLQGLETYSEKDFEGDLLGMLLPGKTYYDTQYYFTKETSFKYTSYVSTMMDMEITTEKDAAGRIFVIRDSFANALIPLLSDQAGECYYTRAASAKSLEKAEDFGADIVIFEIAERNLKNLLEWSM